MSKDSTFDFKTDILDKAVLINYLKDLEKESITLGNNYIRQLYSRRFDFKSNVC